MKTLIIASMLAIIVTGMNAFAGDPCSNYKEIRKSRYSYDIDVRRQRLAAHKEITKISAKIDDAEAKMIDLKAKLLTEPEDKHDAIWIEYDKLDSDITSLWKKKAQFDEKYSSINRNRHLKRFAFRNDELEKLYECIINEPLNKQLATAKNSSEGINDSEMFKELVDRRNKIISQIKTKHIKYDKETALLLDKIEESQENLAESESNLSKSEDESKNDYDKLYDALQKMKDNLKSERDELAQISMQLLEILNMK